MKKMLRIISKILLFISILILAIVLVSNLVIVIRLLFFGIRVGYEGVPNSLWYNETILKGFRGIRVFYYTLREAFILFELLPFIISVIYQILYFKIIKRKLL